MLRLYSVCQLYGGESPLPAELVVSRLLALLPALAIDSDDSPRAVERHLFHRVPVLADILRVANAPAKINEFLSATSSRVTPSFVCHSCGRSSACLVQRHSIELPQTIKPLQPRASYVRPIILYTI